MANSKKNFWSKIMWEDFTQHFRKMTERECFEDIQQSMDDLYNRNSDGTSFGSFMVRAAEIRQDQYPMARENGMKGGRPKNEKSAVDASTRKDEEDRKSGTSTANLSEAIAGMFPTSRNRREGSGSVLRGGCIENGPSRIPATAQQLYDLADRLSVDRDDARQCWEATKERHGKTKDGKEIKDFPAYMVKWCKTTEAKRKSA